ncbi:MAG: 2-hydroxychromene-2-carboxylate isomerase [Mesorhizobium sp.]
MTDKPAAGPILFYFDFASPYAYFALDEIERIGAAHGRRIEWRPVLVWAILKAQSISPPMESPARRSYIVGDMVRSAAFHGLPYKHPSKLPLSAHRALRLYYEIAEKDIDLAHRFGREVFAAFFTRDEDISAEETVTAIAARVGIDEAQAIAGMLSESAKARLAAMVDEAVAAGVVGSPFVVVDGEGFFGADRLPQIEWRLSGGA